MDYHHFQVRKPFGCSCFSASRAQTHWNFPAFDCLVKSDFFAGRLPISRSWLQPPQKKCSDYVIISMSPKCWVYFGGGTGFPNPKRSIRGVLHFVTRHTVDGLLILHQLRSTCLTICKRFHTSQGGDRWIYESSNNISPPWRTSCC